MIVDNSLRKFSNRAFVSVVAKGDVVGLVFFFFQAEDGIRDHCVTGVQTCALPISSDASTSATLALSVAAVASPPSLTVHDAEGVAGSAIALSIASAVTDPDGQERDRKSVV